jgi:ribosomal protein S18 acetylase RimI-like enzyme
MGKRDQQIGPCFTHADYRGQGIFSSVLRLIAAYYSKKCDFVWTYTTHDDVAAQKAFGKAGYKFFSFAEMSLKTKIVRLIS